MPTRGARRIATGYTIVELTIVLAIVAAFAALSWPVLMKPWQRKESQQAAELLREWLIQTRVTAMNDGLIYEFRWKANTNEFEIRTRDPIPVELHEANRLGSVNQQATLDMDRFTLLSSAFATVRPPWAAQMLGLNALRSIGKSTFKRVAGSVFYVARARLLLLPLTQSFASSSAQCTPVLTWQLSLLVLRKWTLPSIRSFKSWK